MISPINITCIIMLCLIIIQADEGQLKQVFMFDRVGCGTCIVHDERKKKTNCIFCKRFFIVYMNYYL